MNFGPRLQPFHSLRRRFFAAVGVVWNIPRLYSLVLLVTPLPVCWLVFAWLSESRAGRPASVSVEVWTEAEAKCRRERGDDVRTSDILITVARQASRSGDLQQATACYEMISSQDDRHGLQALFEYSVMRFENNLAPQAEQGFLTLLQRHREGEPVPLRQLLIARRSLSLLYGLQMRLTERAAILQQLIDSRQADIHEVKYFFFPSLMIWQNAWGAERIDQYLSQTPSDISLQAAAARYLAGQGQPDLAREKLLALHGQDPLNLDLTSWLLEICLDLNDLDMFEQIIRDLPPVSAAEPTLLTQMRGEWYLKKQDWAAAESQFREVLKRDIAHSQATMGLARVLDQTGQPDERDKFLRRASVIAELRVGLTVANPGQTEALIKVSRWCRELQMTAAAEAFEFFALGKTGSSFSAGDASQK